MGRKKVYIENITELELKTLEEGWKNGKNRFFRNRCQCILMSYQRIDVNTLSSIFSVTTTTVYTWIKDWKKEGIVGLITKSGQGRKSILSIYNEKHVRIVETAIKNTAEKGTNARCEIKEKLEIEKGFSKDTLRRFLKKKSTDTRDLESILKRR